MSRSLIIAKSYYALSNCAKNIIVNTLNQSGFKLNLALPTGNSPKLMYQLLVKHNRKLAIDWSNVNFFALDDYIDVDSEHSFANYLWQNLYRFIDISCDQIFNPKINIDYDNLILAKGGLDLTILGVGANGHIAFNEPDTPLASYTHSLWLTESTRQANKSAFDQTQTIPKRAISVGISTILGSRAIIVLVSGKTKFKVLTRFLKGRIESDLPLSNLLYHNNWTIITDLAIDVTNIEVDCKIEIL